MHSQRIHLMAVILLFFLVGCQSSPETPAVITLEPNAAPAATATRTPFLPVEPTVTASLTPSPTPVLCSEDRGRIEHIQIDSQHLPEPLQFRVYLPPCYDFQFEDCYPSLYLIHGQTFSDSQWDNLGMDEAADHLINDEEAPPFLIIMPYEVNSLADIYESGFRESIPDELVPWIDNQFTTCKQRSNRAIGGLSRGGAWSIHLGFSSWQLFGAIGAHSTPPFDGDFSRLPGWLEAIPPEELPRIYLDIGKRDPYYAHAAQLDTSLTQHNIAHEWNTFDGSHTESYWETHVMDYLRWYTRPWSAD